MSAPAEEARPVPQDAARFLKCLDPAATSFSFQTFDDTEARKDKRLARVLHGTLAEHAAELAYLNAKGAGIFVTVNETDGKGRKKENIVRVRAVFADLDGAPLDPVLANGRPPHIVTETSPGKWHAYWRVDGLPLDQFEGVQKNIAARFNGDASVCDLPRVMRLPGFTHRKGAPFVSRIVETSDREMYPADTFERAAGNGHDKPIQDDELIEDDRLIENIRGGRLYHDSLVRLSARLVGRGGMDADVVAESLRKLMNQSTGPRDARWQSRVDEIPGLINSAIENFGKPTADRAHSKADDAAASTQGAAKEEARRISATPFVWVDPPQIPRRRWLYRPHYVRQFVSLTVSTGGVGKSSKIIVEAQAMTSGKALLDIQPARLLRVWYWNGEDPMDELQRRFAAAAKHYHLTAEDFGDRLFVDSGRTMSIVIAEEDVRRKTLIAEPVIQEVIATIREKRIDVIVIDPFVTCHRVNENDNAAIERVAKSWSHVAEEANCAVMLVHHSRKTSGEGVTVDDGRGASALLAAARTARTLNTMTVKEAENAEIEEHERRLYFRSDIGKANLTRPAESAEWFKLVSVDLENAGDESDWDASDKVGVVTSWAYPKATAPQISALDIRGAQDAIKAGGPWREDQRSTREQWVGIPIARTLCLDLDRKPLRRVVANLVRDWLTAGWLKRVERRDGQRKVRTYIEAGNAPVDAVARGEEGWNG